MVREDMELPMPPALNISAKDVKLWWYRDQPSPEGHVPERGGCAGGADRAPAGKDDFMRVGLAQGQAMVRIHDVNAFDHGCSTATSKVVPCQRRPHYD
ncbi:hypothetical protein D623_10016134 [Myotis brandtii]|uniref:Uncharacterized protein n=1 Tax=Myotis brandtii TaxID=109478 RepID=S7P9V6_MYOBR|nr:hypothetical protein D623_10016134 [Myotis brandtii]